MPGVTPAEVLSNFGITLVEDPAENQPRLLVDLPAAELVEHAIRRNEGRMASNGALVIETGERTGRSPNDRFIADTPDVHDKIAWGAVNRPLSIESYEAIKAGIVDYLNERDVFVTRGMAGADRNHTRRLLVACERASQALFIKQMLARPLAREIARTGEPDFCVLAAPGYQCDPAIKGLNSSAAVVINFQERVILVAGTGYSGEIKKSIFSVMNYLLPVEDDVLPMHCSASMDPVTHETAVFFGLSGTGKTTLSANPTRLLIGDDEHGWSDMGIFNIEGGCYAKCEGLDAFHEPEIFNAVRFGAICENVVLDEGRKPNYDDISITHNTRVAYPVEHIPNAWTKGMGTTPSVVLFLTCDAFGVLPPISRLTADAPAPRSASPSPRPRSPRCSESRLCRSTLWSTPRCSASVSPTVARACTWSIPAGSVAATAWAIVSSLPTRAPWWPAPSTVPSRTASSCTTISSTSTFPPRATVCPTASWCRASTGRAPRATTRQRTIWQ